MLNNIGLPGLLLIAVVVLVLFGRGKISSLMGEVGKGITSFKRGVKEGSDEFENAANDDTVSPDPKLRDPKLHDPKLHDPKLHDPKRHDPKLHDPKLHDPKLHDVTPHDNTRV